MYEISRTGSLLPGKLANYGINLFPTARGKGVDHRVRESMGSLSSKRAFGPRSEQVESKVGQCIERHAGTKHCHPVHLRVWLAKSESDL